MYLVIGLLLSEGFLHQQRVEIGVILHGQGGDLHKPVGQVQITPGKSPQ